MIETPRAVVVGYGNPLRGDDGVGPAAIDYLERLPLPPDTGLVTCQQLTPDLAETLSTAKRIILIDASVENPPGAIVLKQVAPVPWLGGFHHHLEPAALLACIKALYGAEPEMWLLTVSSRSMAVGMGLSPLIEAAIPAIGEQVLALLAAPPRA